ncbi:flagellar biosynthetic protein FliR [Oryzibacter oryziterrae]|uniref:flagellar biosynthetic protein FliR n=1 Tax=Oryzibacter oryziterrae TaxID=2766474 RepID=UPI001F2F6C8D|nr:flagellar biosynthetic protein FliR [Oryzibacter oryziterrae]
MIVHVLPDVTVLFLLLFARIGSMVMLMPGVGEQTISATIRLAFALLLTLILYPVEARTLPAGLSDDMNRMLVAMIWEIMIGLGLGLLARLLLSVAQIAGTTIASAIGLGFAQSVDPTMGQQGAILSSFLSVVGVTLIFATDLHHVAIAGIAGSYKLFPPGEMIPLGDFRDAAIMTIADSFKVGIQISAPFLVFALVFNLGLGVLQKLMPQFQVFFMAMPVTIMLGLVFFAFLIGTIMSLYEGHVETGLMRLVPN